MVLSGWKGKTWSHLVPCTRKLKTACYFPGIGMCFKMVKNLFFIGTKAFSAFLVTGGSKTSLTEKILPFVRQFVLLIIIFSKNETAAAPEKFCFLSPPSQLLVPQEAIHITNFYSKNTKTNANLFIHVFSCCKHLRKGSDDT